MSRNNCNKLVFYQGASYSVNEIFKVYINGVLNGNVINVRKTIYLITKFE